ncbi:hypothetical protein G647_09085 [Cladophialophora carrionii CBS 160.54]|uniref:BTB domain-containing protein n=1 Tax=Cladophialophora carrionii CBS 160.54 TaxID=1279043 RepID=V9CYX9_9EURO|nr:uncharacterized protein G647_09085 [Cladophialophora carrionii CBS 160.54]ETI19253.1 hypothetical protein G647_09085 [Cladophialophora carrionii CBS 160.54]
MTPTTPRSHSTRKYAEPTIQILVGDRQEPFHVHYSFLAKTHFFQIHGHPAIHRPSGPSTPASENSPTPSENTVVADEVEIKEELNEDERIENNQATSVTSTSYTLKGIIYEPEAFEIVVNSLYHVSPQTPSHRSALRNFRKAYCLALQYRMSRLQDDIVDCFRNFHAIYNVHFDDLLWLARRISGDEAVVCQVPIIQYLVEQCAYEIYREGHDSFQHHSPGFQGFLRNGNSSLRFELFKAMTRIAMAEHAPDPALGLNQWKVQDWPQYDPNASTEHSVEVIDIDD